MRTEKEIRKLLAAYIDNIHRLKNLLKDMGPSTQLSDDIRFAEKQRKLLEHILGKRKHPW